MLKFIEKNKKNYLIFYVKIYLKKKNYLINLKEKIFLF